MIGSIGSGTPRTTVDTRRGEKRATASPETVEQPAPQQPVRGKSSRRGTIVDTYL
jgi:hypothetical protein